MTDPSTPDLIRLRLAEIRLARSRVLEECAGVSADHGAQRKDGAWSLQNVIEHLVLAERGGFDLIWKAAEAFRHGSPIWEGESENDGLNIEDVVARTWRPKETAPPSAEPSGEWGLQCWLAHLRSCDSLLDQLPDHLDGLPLEKVIYPHFLCGPLNALQRLEFIRFHMEYHLPQVRRLRGLDLDSPEV